jgi:hypothetical protein
VYRLLRSRAQEQGKAELVDSATDQSEVETVDALLSVIRERDAALAGELVHALDTTRFFLLGNQLTDVRERNALQALSRMIKSFLGLSVPVLGSLQRRDQIHASVSRRRPFVVDSTDPEARLLHQIAQQLLRAHASGKQPDRTGDFLLATPLERDPMRPSGIEIRGSTEARQEPAVLIPVPVLDRARSQ